MIPSSKFLANFLHGGLGDFPDDVNGDLTGLGDGGVFLIGADIRGRNVIGLGYLFDDALDGNRDRLIVVQDLLDDVLCNAEGRL